MRICVLGAGVVGLATAYFLAREGHAVTIVDRNGLPGQETSFANGGQLSYSYVAPLAAPGVIANLPKYLLSPSSPLRLTIGRGPFPLAWTLHFLWACRRGPFRRHTAELASLADFSRDAIKAMVAAEPIDFDYTQPGKLVIYRDAKALRAAIELAEFQRTLGAEQTILNGGQCIDVEPALHPSKDAIAGGVFTPSDEAGDCYKFCVAVDQVLHERYGVRRLYHHEVGSFARAGRRIRALLTNKGEIEADLFVVAAGLPSRSLLRGLGVTLPLQGLKGYSLTMPVLGDAAAPNVSVTDSDNKVLYAKVGGQLRIAAMVDIGSPHGAIDANRIATLKRQVSEMFPALKGLADAEAWSAMRPATAQGKPIIGATPFENLFVNVGHGALGFTLGAGSGRLLAHLIDGKTAPIDAAPFRLGMVH